MGMSHPQSTVTVIWLGMGGDRTTKAFGGFRPFAGGEPRLGSSRLLFT